MIVSDVYLLYYMIYDRGYHDFFLVGNTLLDGIFKIFTTTHPSCLLPVHMQTNITIVQSQNSGHTPHLHGWEDGCRPGENCEGGRDCMFHSER